VFGLLDFSDLGLPSFFPSTQEEAFIKTKKAAEFHLVRGFILS
jgi:hypothetical protein